MQIILSPVASLKWYIRGGALVLCRKIGFGPNNFFRVIKGVVMILGSWYAGVKNELLGKIKCEVFCAKRVIRVGVETFFLAKLGGVRNYNTWG